MDEVMAAGIVEMMGAVMVAVMGEVATGMMTVATGSKPLNQKGGMS